MRPRATVCVVLLSLLGSCASSSVVRAHAGYMQVTPGGDLALEDSSSSMELGDIKIDVEDEFNIEDGGAPFARVEADFGDWTLTGSGYVFSESASSVLTQPFGDLPAGSTVDSDLDIVNVKSTLTYDFSVLPTLDLGIGLAINYFDIDFTVNATSPVVGFEDIDFRAPIPMLYGRARLDVGIVDGMLEVGWLSLDIGDARGNFLDIEAMVTVNIFPAVELMAGYRYSLIDAIGEVDNQEFDTDLDIQGLFFGGGMNF